jgi:hypothetical protein
MSKAEMILIKQSQEATFGHELKRLKSGELPPSKSRLSKLDSIITEDGLLGVRGRLINSDRPYEERHPIILDGNDTTTQLLVQD